MRLCKCGCGKPACSACAYGKDAPAARLDRECGGKVDAGLVASGIAVMAYSVAIGDSYGILSDLCSFHQTLVAATIRALAERNGRTYEDIMTTLGSTTPEGTPGEVELN